MNNLDTDIIDTITRNMVGSSLNWTPSAVTIDGDTTITGTIVIGRDAYGIWANLNGVILGGRGRLVGGLRDGMAELRYLAVTKGDKVPVK